MKHFRGFALILLITFFGECAYQWLPFPIPASIYGFLMFFIALQTKIIDEESVEKPATFFVEIMPVLFVPAAVGVLDVWGVLQQALIPLLLIIGISTLMVAYVTGVVAQKMICRRTGRKDADDTV